MKKTKKEKLAAAVRRQKEIERIQSQPAFLPKIDKTPKETEPANFSSYPKLNSLQDKLSGNLTNLSYLPNHLIKIGLVTFILIFVEIILAKILAF